MVYVDVTPGQGTEFPLYAMVRTLVASAGKRSLERAADRFNDLSLDQQLDILKPGEARKGIEALADKLKPGRPAMQTISSTHNRDCGSSSGSSTTIYSKHFIVGERGFYFAATVERKAAVHIARDNIRPAKGPRIIRLTPNIDAQGHCYADERWTMPSFSGRYREIKEGDICLDSREGTLYLDRTEQPYHFHPSPRLVLSGVSKNNESLRMLRQHLRKTG